MNINFDHFDWSQATEYTKKMVSFNSYETAGKLPVLKLVEDILKKETNAQITIYDAETDAPFLIALLKADQPKFKLLLEGHLDVVSPEGMDAPFDPSIKDGIMYGRGTCDMKGGCGSMLAAFVAAAKDGKPEGDIYLMYSTDEEYSSQEVIKALKEGYLPKVDFAMIAEPTNCVLCIAHKGNAWMDVEFHGKSAHASSPELGINTIYMASDFICRIKKYIDTTYEGMRSEDYGIPTMNVGVINGGSMPNVVPPYTKVRLDKRYLPGDTIDSFRKEIEEILESCKRDDPTFDAEITYMWDGPSVLVEKDNPLLIEIKEAIGNAIGEPKLDGKGFFGWGEGGYIQPFGIPVVYYGPGEAKYAHAPNEQTKICDIEKVAKAYYSVVKTLCFHK